MTSPSSAHRGGSTGQVRVLQWGLGAMGSGMARLVLDKPGLQLVAAVDSRPDLIGRDLGEVLGLGRELGVVVTGDPDVGPGPRHGGRGDDRDDVLGP